MNKQYLLNIGRALIGRTAIQYIQNKFNQTLFIGNTLTFYDPKGPVYVEEGYNKNSDVYAIVSQASRKLATVPCFLKNIKDKNSKKQFESLINKKGILSPAESFRKSILESKAYQESEIKEPLEVPNYYQTWNEFYELWMTFMMLTGNAYIYMQAPEEGARAGQPFQVYLLPAHYTQIVLKSDFKQTLESISNIESPISHYIITIGSQYIQFEADNVIHTKLPNPNYGLNGEHLYGQSPLRAALKDLQTANEANNQNVKTMKNGGSYGFIHGTDSNNPLTPEQAMALKEKLTEMELSTATLSRFSGSSTPLGFTRLSLTTDELKPFEYLSYSQKQICNVFGWSDELLNNDAASTYDNVNMAWTMAISNCVLPFVKILESALNKYYYPRFKGYENVVKVFDVSEMPEMQGDMKELADWLAVAMDRGVISPDEFRTALKYPEVGSVEMQTRYIRSGYVPLSEVSMIDEVNLDDESL